MKIASVAEVKAQFSTFLKLSQSAPVVVTRNGKPAAVILGVQDEDEVDRLSMVYSPRLREVLDKSRNDIRKGRAIPHAQFWAEADPSASRRGGRYRRRKRRLS